MTMLKNFILFTLMSVLMTSANGASNSETENRSTELGRPLKVLTDGMSGVLLRQILDLGGLGEIDFTHKSDKLSDFDMLVVFVDEFEEATALGIVEQLGLGDRFAPEPGSNPFMITVSIQFAEIENRFPIIAIDRRQFYARDISCHAPFLRDIILHFDPDTIVKNETSYRAASDCGGSI
ncbi:hypothetical protein [Ruegeria meonggei]|nr:hypothetical protein [Ruegeria meonggei]